MGKYERLLIYSLVFLFFPGLILFAPFLNLRMRGQGDRWILTKANVIQLGLLLFLLGGLAYSVFLFYGFDLTKAGIASELVLVLLLLIWVFSYFLRVITGKMTFMEQRKRYRSEYQQITDKELKARFDSMSNEDKIRLIKEVEKDNNNNEETN